MELPSLSVPYSRRRCLMGLSGLFLTVAGLSTLLLLLEVLWGQSPGQFLLLLPSLLGASFFALFGVQIMLQSLLIVHFTPEGITVTVLGKTLRQYPVENFRLCCQVNNLNSHWIGVSNLDIDQLVCRYTRRLRKAGKDSGSGNKDSQIHDRQIIFARDQLYAESRKALINPLDRDFFWIAFTPERRGFLRSMYPQLPWLNLKNANTVDQPSWNEPYDALFCRDLCRPEGKNGLALVCLLFTVPFYVITLIYRMDAELLFACLVVSALFGAVWHWGRQGYDEFWVYPDRLRITRGSKEVDMIPAEEIRTIFQGYTYYKRSQIQWLAISRLTEQELAEKITGRYRSQEDKMLIKACRQLPNSDRKIIAWCWFRNVFRTVLPARYAQTLKYSPHREKLLRKQYPDAVWIDLEYL